MPQAARNEEPDNARIVLGLLEFVERDGAQSQRKLASDLGIALGLVNAYLKRCVKKGLLKISQAPPRRYAYYLTPHGFAEKSRLTVEYLSTSFSFFRRAREDCSSVLNAARARGWNRIALFGVSISRRSPPSARSNRASPSSRWSMPKLRHDRFVGTPVVSRSRRCRRIRRAGRHRPSGDARIGQAVADQLDAGRVLVPGAAWHPPRRATESAA